MSRAKIQLALSFKNKYIWLTIHMRTGFLVQKLKCLLPNDVSLANLNRSGSVTSHNVNNNFVFYVTHN